MAEQPMDDGFLEIRISGKKIYCNSHKEGGVTCKTIRSKSTGKGKPVFTGMVVGTLAGLVFIPLMYILIQTITDRKKVKGKNAESKD